MPDDLLLDDGTIMRQADAAYVYDCIRELDCCSVVGVSNMGKSALLRLLAEPGAASAYLGESAASYAFVLIDCNRMLELSEQGFYELVLRCVLERFVAQAVDGSLIAEVRSDYDRLIHPSSPFDIPLSFNRGMSAAVPGWRQHVVLLLDEFDQVLAEIQGRVFLNLRALRDQYKRQLVYVTATDRPLRDIRESEDVLELFELFSHHVYHLPPLNQADVRLYVQRFAREEGVTFDGADEQFIHEWAGGHPGLLEATCRALGRVTGAVERDELQDWVIHREVGSWLPNELSVRVECRKVWDDLLEAEREALMGPLVSDQGLNEQAVDSLRRKHILKGPGDEPRFFARLFGEYVNRLRVMRRPVLRGIRVDVDAGEVYVDGRTVETLTNLEFRLMLLLYGRLGQIVSKYDVVEAVWGEEYIDQVDDARIEKLVSRLRSKIELDPKNPTYLVTVRGRGYRLQG
jgi:hypothetical protein